MTTPVPIAGMAALTHWGVIRARGADAAGFLHTQLTNDIEHLDGSRARLAGYCTPKGRLLATFIVWKADDDDFLLACHASVLPATLKRLSMYVLRAKCKLSDASGEVRLLGVAGVPARAEMAQLPVWGQRAHEGGHWIRLPDGAGTPRALLAGTQGPAEAPSLAAEEWSWLEVQSGVPVIEEATVEQFVPQMLNFELVDGVDFQKGCYPGQEIVARAQYRGMVKRRMVLVEVDARARAGQEVFHSADPGQPAGMVANAAPHPADPGASSALVEVKLAALEEGVLHLGAPDGPVLRRMELPYPLPLQADQAA